MARAIRESAGDIKVDAFDGHIFRDGRYVGLIAGQTSKSCPASGVLQTSTIILDYLMQEINPKFHFISESFASPGTVTIPETALATQSWPNNIQSLDTRQDGT